MVNRVLAGGRAALSLAVAGVLVLGLAGCGSGEDPVMPDVVGQQLDVALSDIERAGISDEVEVLGGGLFGVVDESNWEVCDQIPAAGEAVTDAPRVTVDRSCSDDAAEPSEGATEEPAETYAYAGPLYEVVAVDQDQGPAKLDQYWVYTAEFDYSTDAYKDQIKLIISDIARTEGTDEFFAEVVTNKEIALAESPSTYDSFIEEHGTDYAVNTIPEMEKTGWVASYSGGYDWATDQPSDSADAFQIIWWPYGAEEFETWKPEPVS